jgi:hypothetical protein
LDLESRQEHIRTPKQTHKQTQHERNSEMTLAWPAYHSPCEALTRGGQRKLEMFGSSPSAKSHSGCSGDSGVPLLARAIPAHTGQCRPVCTPTDVTDAWRGAASGVGEAGAGEAGTGEAGAGEAAAGEAGASEACAGDGATHAAPALRLRASGAYSARAESRLR